MMIVKIFPVNPFMMNCYIYFNEENKQGVIIDPGAFTVEEENSIYNFIQNNGINIQFILNTHGHIDHILGNYWAKKKFNVPLMMHKDDLPLVEKSGDQASMFGISFPRPPVPDKFITEEDKIEFDDTVLDIIQTPGHSPGSVCYVDKKEKIIFGGDCVFRGSIGRTDLWRGDMGVLMSSIYNKILTYPDDYTIYPGHYEETTVGEEKANNPFL
jgi:hydroxyacylglutathione hydrolase